MYRVIFSRMSIKRYGEANQREIEYDEKEFNKFIEQKKREGFKLLISVQNKNIAMLSKETRDGFEEEATENVSHETIETEVPNEKYSKSVQALLDANPDLDLKELKGTGKDGKITVSDVKQLIESSKTSE